MRKINAQPKNNQKNAGLVRRGSGLMALEQRFMFDGAAVSDSIAAFDSDIHSNFADSAPQLFVLEQLVLGPYAPSGFKDILDFAS